MAVMPILLAAVAIAGLVYVILLPVCGIASIAEGVATAAWSRIRALARRSERRLEPK
jgi:hypothetical protein